MLQPPESPLKDGRGLTEIRIRGRDTTVPSINFDGYSVTFQGRVFRRAEIFDEMLVTRADIPHPETLIELLHKNRMSADILSIAQRMPDVSPRFPYRYEWDNWAVASCSSFTDWWNSLPQESRKNARQAEKRGVKVREVQLDEALVYGIKRIYDETPIRQGKLFWHYGKSFEAIKKENSTYINRSIFVGAFVGEELIGFVKLVGVDDIAILIQILSMNSHRDKKPMNALLRHTIEICGMRGFKSLVYGQYHYGTTNDSSLTEFKRRNGFIEVRYPRYYIPLTLRGQLALCTHLYRGWRGFIPPEVSSALLHSRAALLQWFFRRTPR